MNSSCCAVAQRAKNTFFLRDVWQGEVITEILAKGDEYWLFYTIENQNISMRILLQGMPLDAVTL